jgi:hypothetical protein
MMLIVCGKGKKDGGGRRLTERPYWKKRKLQEGREPEKAAQEGHRSW